MESKQLLCPNGHYYNTAVHSKCPVCGAIGSEKPNTAKSPDAGRFVPTDPAKSRSFPPDLLSDSSLFVPSADSLQDPWQQDPWKQAPRKQYSHSHPLPSTKPVVGKLTCIDGPEPGKSWDLHAEENYIGQVCGDILIPWDEQIDFENGAIIECFEHSGERILGIAEGHSFVEINGVPILEDTVLQPGDVITIGTTHFTVTPLVPSPPPKKPPVRPDEIPTSEIGNIVACPRGHCYNIRHRPFCPICGAKEFRRINIDPLHWSIQPGRPATASARSPKPVIGQLVCIDGPEPGSALDLHPGYNHIGWFSGDFLMPWEEQIYQNNHFMLTYFPERDLLYVNSPDFHKALFCVNGEKVYGPTVLHAGDVITFGCTRLTVTPLVQKDAPRQKASPQKAAIQKPEPFSPLFCCVDPIPQHLVSAGRLICISGKHYGLSWGLYPRDNFIGRTRDNGESLSISGDEQIASQKHTLITYNRPNHTFSLSPALNGGIVELNGEEVSTPTVLHKKDIITIGITQFQFYPNG